MSAKRPGCCAAVAVRVVERIVEPVTVVDDASVGKILVSLREADIDLECAIESEEGERVEWRIRRDDLVSLSL